MTVDTNRLRCSAMIALWIIPAWTLAHHGVGAQFDLTQTIELQGEVKRLIWRNPHVRITLGVINENGAEEDWVVEAQSVSMLRQRDITEVMFDIGDSISLAGNPARGGRAEIYATNVLLPDGREIMFSQNAEPRWSDEALGLTGPRFVTSGDPSAPDLGLFRTWSSARGQGLTNNLDLATHPLSAAARTQADAYDRLTDNLATGECAPKGMPLIVGNPYPRDFTDHGDTIIMRIEEDDTVRTIHMTPPPEGFEPLRSPLGYSIGHWEDRTLVVNTTHVNDGVFSQGISLSEDLEIVERFTPSVDGSRLDYEMTISDPAVFLEPVELGMYWIYVPGVTVEPYECVEG